MDASEFPTVRVNALYFSDGDIKPSKVSENTFFTNFHIISTIITNESSSFYVMEYMQPLPLSLVLFPPNNGASIDWLYALGYGENHQQYYHLSFEKVMFMNA